MLKDKTVPVDIGASKLCTDMLGGLTIPWEKIVS